MSKLSARLDDKSIKILKREVKKRPCLWNSADENYNDRFCTALAWDEISGILKIPDDVARMKWKNLRDLFIKEVKKQNYTKPGDYTGKWRHFKSLWFLYKPCIKISNKADPTVENVDDNTSYEYSSSPEPVESVESNIKSEPLEEKNEVTMYFEQPEELEDPIEPTNKRKLVEVRVEDESDSDMLFLKSLSPYFKQLQPIRKLLVRSKIQELLYNEILQQQSSSANGHR